MHNFDHITIYPEVSIHSVGNQMDTTSFMLSGTPLSLSPELTEALKKLVPTRLIKNEFYDSIAKAEDNGATAEELREILGKGRAMKGIFEGNLIEGELEIGQIASLIHDLPPVQDVMEQIVSEYNKRIGELQNL